MDPMWGGTVAVDHTDGTQTIYCGIAPEKALKAGDRVTAGQMLGSVDTVTAEVAMESHLHFAAKKDGKFIDPSHCRAWNKSKAPTGSPCRDFCLVLC